MVSFPYLFLFQVLKLQAKQVHSLAKEAVAKTEAALQIAEKDFEKALEEGMDTSEVYQVCRAFFFFLCVRFNSIRAGIQYSEC